MSLNNTDSSNGYIESTAPNGVAVSEPQVSGGSDFIGTQNIVGKFEFNNISESTSADILVTSEPIQDGDNLVVMMNDGTINEIVANGVTGSGPYQLDLSFMMNGEVPDAAYRVDEGILFNSTEATLLGDSYTGSVTTEHSGFPSASVSVTDAVREVDGDTQLFTVNGDYPAGWEVISVVAGVEYTVTWEFDNTNWDEAGVRVWINEDIIAGTEHKVPFGISTYTRTFVSPITTASARIYYVYYYSLPTSLGKKCRVTSMSVTSGVNKLLSTRTFNNTTFTSNTDVVTTVNMSATGNKMTELTFDVMS